MPARRNMYIQKTHLSVRSQIFLWLDIIISHLMHVPPYLPEFPHLNRWPQHASELQFGLPITNSCEKYQCTQKGGNTPDLAAEAAA